MKTRNVAVDVMKYVAAIMVIAIHTRPLELANGEAYFFLCQIVCRLAVPFFAICTGFYLAQANISGGGNSLRNACRRTFRHILLLYLGWSLFYFICLLWVWHAENMLSAGMVVGFVKSMAVSHSYYHLWYLLSLLYALPIFFIVMKVVAHRYFPIIIVVLWAMQSLNYGYMLFLPELMQGLFEKMGVMDALFTGTTRMLPLLMSGVLLSERCSMRNTRRYALLFATFFACYVVEAYALRSQGGQKFSYLFAVLPASVSFFALIYSIDGLVQGDWSRWSRVLAKSSLVVYCLHPAVINLLQKWIHSNTGLFFMVVVITSIMALSYQRIASKKTNNRVLRA